MPSSHADTCSALQSVNGLLFRRREKEEEMELASVASDARGCRLTGDRLRREVAVGGVVPDAAGFDDDDEGTAPRRVAGGGELTPRSDAPRFNGLPPVAVARIRDRSGVREPSGDLKNANDDGSVATPVSRVDGDSRCSVCRWFCSGGACPAPNPDLLSPAGEKVARGRPSGASCVRDC